MARKDRKGYTAENVRLGENLALTRRGLQMDQATVCKRLRISVPRYSQWETGYCRPSVFAVRQLASVFGCTMEALTEGCVDLGKVWGFDKVAE